MKPTGKHTGMTWLLKWASHDRYHALFNLRRLCHQLMFVFTLLLGCTGQAYADLAGCDAALRPTPKSSGSMTFILALDGISVPESVPGLEDPWILARGLTFKVATNLEALEHDQLGTGNFVKTRFQVVACPQRQPHQAGDIENEAGLFLDNGVVLELWGSFDLDEAVFSHAILPIYVRGAGEEIRPGKVFDFAFPYKTTTPVVPHSELRFLKTILAKSLPLRAYAAVGAAAIALDERKYDLARRYYCDSRQIMLDIESEQGGLSSSDRDLLGHIERMSRKVITLAKNDADYHGVMVIEWLLPGTGCGGSSS
jgi:hypothetical protein